MAIIKYHHSYHEEEPLNANGPYQYSPEQLAERKAKGIIDNLEGLQKVLSSKTPSFHLASHPIETQESAGFLIEPDSLTKEEFKELQRQDIMNEWEELNTEEDG